MNEYDNDNDELDDASSGNNPFRARSNTWPLNRPDFTVPSSNACIDETLPEIELEEDDLFTTNENWSAGFVDHDIMSWDPILNAHNQQQPHLQASMQPTIIHHQPQPQQTASHAQQQQQLNTTHQSSQSHQRQQSIHLHHQQQSIQHHPQQQQHDHQHHQNDHQHHQGLNAVNRQRPHHQHNNTPHHGLQEAPYLETVNAGPANGNILVASQPNAASQQCLQPPKHSHSRQPSPLQHDQLQHQVMNSSRCLETDEYHIQQLHQLRIDGGPNDLQQEHYPTVGPDSAPSVCIPIGIDHSSSNDYGIGISPDQHHSHNHPHHHHDRQHHHHQSQSQLQSLTSASYDYEHPHHNQPQNDYDLKIVQDDNLNNHHHQHHLNHHDRAQQHHHNQHHPPDPTISQIQHQPHYDQHSQQHIHSHHFHDLDNGLGPSPNMLSSSLNTSDLGLGTDLEDLDYKPTMINNYDETLQQPANVGSSLRRPTKSELRLQGSDVIKAGINGQTTSSSNVNLNKQNESTSASKTKLNAPRRNAWGNLSYADLISQAIESTSDKRLTLSQIYDWMVQHVPYFKDKGDSNSSAGWKNSVRHNLSLHSRFKRLQNEGTGKSSWWTINPEANIGKCARRRAASMEASKYEKKRGRAKKRAEAIRQGLISYPSLTNSSLNASTNTLGEQQTQAQSLSQYISPTTSATLTIQPESATTSQQQAQEHNLQTVDQFANPHHSSQQSPPQIRPQLQIQTLENYNIDHPSQQQQQHLRQLQQADLQEQQQQQQQYVTCYD